MFLVSQSSDQAVEPVLHAFQDVTIRHPVRLSVPRWHLYASDMWFVTGGDLYLRVISKMLQEAHYASVPTEKRDGRPATIVVQADANVTTEPPTLWQRLRRAFFPNRQAPSEATEQLLQTWYSEGIGPGDALERRVLERLAVALEKQPLVIVLDRIQRFLRPQVRFRVSATLRKQCCEQGLCIVALSVHTPDAWTAIDRRAQIHRGRFEVVHRFPETRQAV